MKFWTLSLALVACVSPSMANVGITTTSVPNGTVKTPYSAVVSASGGCTPYKWVIVSGALPAGLSAKASSTTTSLTLAGTPTTAATYNFAVKVTGCGGGVSQASYKVVVQTAAVNLGITTTSVPNGTVKTAYSAVIRASGGCTPYKWAIVSGALPAGLSAKASSTTTSLTLAGTPTTAATYNFVVKVAGCGGGVSQASYKVVVQAATANLGIPTTSVPNGTVNTAYSAAVRASGGCTPYTWAIVSGALPAGVSAKASSTTTSLNLAGTPTTAATYNFTVKVTGCGGGVSQASYKVVVQAAANHVVELSWNSSPSSDVVGYNVYRSSDAATWKKINVSLIGSTLYSDTTVANNSTYYYAATAVGNSGVESSKTAAVKVVVP
jgi:large repetitive protein